VEKNIYLFLKFIMQVSMFIGLCIAIYRLDWESIFVITLIIIVTLIPMRLSARFKFFIPIEIEVMSVAIIYASLFLGEFSGFYETYWWWDLLLHSSAGFLFGVFGFLTVWVMNEDPEIHLRLSPLFMSLFAFSFSIVAGVFWEIFEFFMDQLFGFNMQKSGLMDTMWDLIVVCAGAFFVAFFGYTYLKFGAESFASRWFKHFVESNPAIFVEKNN